MKKITAAFEIMNRKELKLINAYLKRRYGVFLDNDFAYLMSTKCNLYMCSRDLGWLQFQNLRISSIGLYLGEWKNGELRLSMEGSQLLGPKAAKNVVVLGLSAIWQWMRGEDVVAPASCNGYVLVSHGNDFFGAGLVKEGKLLNYVPKARRLQEINPS